MLITIAMVPSIAVVSFAAVVAAVPAAKALLGRLVTQVPPAVIVRSS